MKKTLLIATLALSINVVAQKPTSNIHHVINFGQTIQHQISHLRSLTPIADSTYQWTWDTLSLAWKISTKVINIHYDASNNMTSESEQSWNGSMWVNAYQYTYTYDANNNKTSELDKTWNGSAWVDSTQYTYAYDANNNQTSELDKTWNGTAWVNGYQYTYTYDANNNQTSELDQSWNGTAWVNGYQYTYVYDANNNKTSELDKTWNGTAWVNGYQNTYTYDANNNQTSGLQKSWSGTTWVNSYQYTDTYDANNNLTSELYQSWSSGAWVNSDQYTLTYANNNMTKVLDRSWNGTVWVNAYQATYTYDVNNFEKSNTNKYWNTAGTKVTSGDSTHIYFHTVTGINNLMVSDENILIAPNPFNSQTTITFTQEQKNITIKIIDLLGKEIKTTNFTGKQLLIEKEEMNEGIYFVQIIEINKNMVNKKIIIQ